MKLVRESSCAIINWLDLIMLQDFRAGWLEGRGRGNEWRSGEEERPSQHLTHPTTPAQEQTWQIYPCQMCIGSFKQSQVWLRIHLQRHYVYSYFHGKIYFWCDPSNCTDIMISWSCIVFWNLEIFHNIFCDSTFSAWLAREAEFFRIYGTFNSARELMRPLCFRYLVHYAKDNSMLLAV